ncbi:MAG: hypothetical protein O2942_11160 [Proteobacteria bacterium]|nr:hypothetical protein [Pseudomonadota bacterium]
MEALFSIALISYVIWYLYSRHKKKAIESNFRELYNQSLNLMNEKKAKIEAKGIPYVHHNLKEGVFQMVDFPYNSFEEWHKVYNEAAIASNKALVPTTTEDGVKISILDMLDIEPCVRAYEHHLNPEKLGSKFGEQFSIGDVEFQD